MKVHWVHVTQLWIFRLSLYGNKYQVKEILCLFQSKLPKFSFQTFTALLEEEAQSVKAIKLFCSSGIMMGSHSCALDEGCC